MTFQLNKVIWNFIFDRRGPNTLLSLLDGDLIAQVRQLTYFSRNIPASAANELESSVIIFNMYTLEFLRASRYASNYTFRFVIDTVPGVCFTDVSWALKMFLWIYVQCRNRTSYANFKQKLSTCAQRHAVGKRKKFQH